MAEPPLGWTVQDAVGELAKTGLPVDGLGKIISLLPGFQRIGEEKSGERGGRGCAIYDIGEIQLLQAALARWLIPRDPPSGGT